MGRFKYPYLIFGLCVTAVISGLSEVFGHRTREERERSN
jgi:hypothetical protein